MTTIHTPKLDYYQECMHKAVNDLAFDDHGTKARLLALPVSTLDPLLDVVKSLVRAVTSLWGIGQHSLETIYHLVCCPFSSNRSEIFFKIVPNRVTKVYINVEGLATEICLIPVNVLRTPFLIIGNLYSLLSNPEGTVEHFYLFQNELDESKNPFFSYPANQALNRIIRDYNHEPFGVPIENAVPLEEHAYLREGESLVSERESEGFRFPTED